MSRSIRKLIPNFIRRSYALKFAIALLVLGVIVGGIGTFATGEITAQTEENVNAEYQSLATSEAKTVANWQERNVMAARSTSTSDDLRSDDSSEVTLFLQNKRSELYDDVHAIHVVDHLTADEPVIGSTSMKSGVSFREQEREWITSVSLDQVSEVYVSDVYDVGGTPVVGFVSRVGGGDNRVLVVEVRVSDLAETFQGSARADGGFTMVVNGDGTIAFDERNERVLTEYGDESAMKPVRLAEDLRQSEESLERDAGVVQMAGNPSVIDESYTVGYAPVDGTDWVVLTHAPTTSVYGFVQAVRDYGYIATIASVVSIVLIGAVLGRNTATAIDRLTAKTKRMEEGDLDVELSSSRIDSIGQLYDGFASMRDSLKNKIREAEEAREEAERARMETERINRHLEQKADEYSTVMQSAAAGDLTVRMEPESESEAMREIGTEFNEMITEIERTTDYLKSFATEVAAASEEVTASSEEIHSASEQVTESIQEISDGAHRQNKSLQSVNDEMNGLSTTIEQISASSNEVADIAEVTAETGKAGREAARQAIEGMKQVNAESDEAVAAIEDLEEEMDQIDELIEFISEIAAQTNMLALNANIEASRSGESGEGFSAVAGEVKDLSEKTKSAADDVETLIDRILQQTERTAKEVQKTSDRIAEHTDSVEEAADSLAEIADYAEHTNTGVQEISAASEEQAASTQEVVSMVDEVATISEETTSEAENVAASAEEQTTAIVETSANARQLVTQANQLSEALDSFETDVDVAFDRNSPLGSIADVSDDDPAMDTEREDDADRADDRRSEPESDADPQPASDGEPATVTGADSSEDGVDGQTVSFNADTDETRDSITVTEADEPITIDEAGEGPAGSEPDESPATAENDDESAITEAEGEAGRTAGSDVDGDRADGNQADDDDDDDEDDRTDAEDAFTFDQVNER